MTDTKEYKEYNEKKIKLREKYPGFQKLVSLKKAMTNIHKYDEDIQFLILHDLLEHEYILLKAKNYRAKQKIAPSKTEQLKQAIIEGLQIGTKINKISIEANIPSNLVTPDTTQPNSPK